MSRISPQNRDPLIHRKHKPFETTTRIRRQNDILKVTHHQNTRATDHFIRFARSWRRLVFVVDLSLGAGSRALMEAAQSGDVGMLRGAALQFEEFGVWSLGWVGRARHEFDMDFLREMKISQRSKALGLKKSREVDFLEKLRSAVGRIHPEFKKKGCKCWIGPVLRSDLLAIKTDVKLAEAYRPRKQPWWEDYRGRAAQDECLNRLPRRFEAIQLARRLDRTYRFDSDKQKK
ncbi:hypothetical protein BSKO_12994 [Bryopsis sp. KO-2023]|nr:hypothetical protein BSKO_12994 [Bryopsis sp. KO-2023]